MDINRVRYFNVFAETGSLVKASEILHISQPALSKALKTLEAEIGLKLIEAEGRGLRLTEAGKRFRNKVQPLINEWLDIPHKLKDEEIWHPTKIGSFEVFTTYFLARLAHFVDKDGLEIHELGPGRLEQAIVDGVVDLGITYLPIPKAGVEFVEVVKIKMGVFGVVEKFDDMDFASLPFIIPLLPTEGAPSKVTGLDGWPDHRFERHVRYRVTLMESAMALCRQGHGVAYLPKFVVNLSNEVLRPSYQLREIKSPLAERERSQSVFLVYRKGAAETPLHRQVAKSLRSLKS